VRAADTNVLVRLLTADDPAQLASARAFIADHEVFVPVTVLLETDWVLRRAYRFDRKRIAVELRRLGGLSSIILEDAERVRQALDLVDNGLDFADALHLSRSADCTDFATFDAAMARRAINAVPPVTLLGS
jgi:predicted nucleic-acid-binding protein